MAAVPTLEPPICGTDPTNLWGHLDMLHWVESQGDWMDAMSLGNGYDSSSEPAGGILVKGLFDIDLAGTSPAGDYHLRLAPYGNFIASLESRAREFDLLVFPYDWRLSCTANARRLAEAVNLRWWPGYTPGAVPDEDRVTIVAHSLGGLVARSYIEGPDLQGDRYVRKLVTVGTPHLGAPESYTSLLAATRFLDFGRTGAVLKFFATLFDEEDHIPTAFLPEKQQARLLSRFASVVELVPVYDFVTIRGATQAITETVRDLASRLPSRGVNRVVGGFRGSLIAEEHLECFLQQHGVEYQLVAVGGTDTVTGYERPENRPLRTAEGDGLAPVHSAGLTAYSVHTQNLHSEVLTRRDVGERDHHLLFDSDVISEFCFDHVRTWTAESRPSFERPTARSALSTLAELATKPQSSVGDERRFQKEAGQRYVVSLVTLEFADSDRAANFPATLVSRGGKVYASGPRFARWPVQRVAGCRFAYIESTTASQYGGLVILPDACSTRLEVMTWNIGASNAAVPIKCSDGTHAEYQLETWLREQRPGWPWLERLVGITVVNRTTRARRTGMYNPGASPCSACAGTLAQLLTQLLIPSAKKRPKARLEWVEPYVAPGSCSYITDFNMRDYNQLKRAGWDLGTWPKPEAIR